MKMHTIPFSSLLFTVLLAACSSTPQPESSTQGQATYQAQNAQQVPIPKTAAEVPGPPSGTAMTTWKPNEIERVK
jgi:PBP1b-binding outer membrane lipoprotein LpoB